MQLNTSLTFNGTCEEAFKFYAKCLGGEIQTIMKWGDSPMADQVAPALKDKIMHSSMVAGESLLMGSDSTAGDYEAPKGFAVTVQVEDSGEAERVFQALSEGATVTMPIQQTFWTARFGMLTDKYGIPWMVNCLQQPA